MSRSNLSW